MACWDVLWRNEIGNEAILVKAGALAHFCEVEITASRMPVTGFWPIIIIGCRYVKRQSRERIMTLV